MAAALKSPMTIEAGETPRNRDAEAPIVIHCSLGTSRTGGLIALDICAAEIQSGGEEFDVVDKVLKHVRKQRPGSVDTENQYICIYLAAMSYALTADPNRKLEDFSPFAASK